jgi:tetraacyldisaccharide 4'-kinase
LLGPLPGPEQVGDEPALIASRTGAPVAVGVDRPAAARLLVGEGLDVIVADDGLQHYALVRDVEICVLDGVRRLGNGKLLPAGPLREPASRLGEVDFIVCNGREPQPGETPMSLVADTSVSLIDRSIRKPLVMFSQSRVHAIAGIGHPQRFFDSLREYGIDVIEHPFSDHHRYTPDDLAFDGDLPILMTEKDAVKCRAFAKPDWWSVPVAAALPQSFFDAITQRLRHVASRSAAPSGL